MVIVVYIVSGLRDQEFKVSLQAQQIQGQLGLIETLSKKNI